MFQSETCHSLQEYNFKKHIMFQFQMFISEVEANYVSLEKGVEKLADSIT